MDSTHLAVLALAVGVTALLTPFARKQYVRDALNRMRATGRSAEDFRPKTLVWYRLRAGVLTFCAIIMSHPIARWAFPDERFLRIDSPTDAAVFGAIAVICSSFAGHEIGADWHGYAEESYRAAKEDEAEKPRRIDRPENL